MTPRRISVIPVAAGGAVLIGGVAQTYVWRWGFEGLTNVTNSQFAWMLLCFGVAWAWARGRLLSGLLAGGLTGLALIASYYGVQWLADGRHAATAQFTKASGIAWTLAAIGGGALAGVLGALASSPAETAPVRKAAGISTAALVLGLGWPVWFLIYGNVLTVAGTGSAIACYAAAGVCLLVVGMRQCGFWSFVRGLVLGASASVFLLGGLFVLQSTVLYTTL